VLVIGAVLDVPIFLACLFMLQTKFRPEMQEDEFYWRYLEKRYSTETAKTELIEVAKPSDSMLEFEPRRAPVKRRGTPSVAEIHMNDLLPAYQSLREALLKAGYKIYDTFGTTSRGKRVPSPFIIAISDGAAIEAIQDAIKISLPHGLEGVAHASEPEWPNRIYIGAYSYEVNPYVPINAEIRQQLLSPNLNWSQLLQIFAEATVPPPKAARESKA
jgi:hypothetical protein